MNDLPISLRLVNQWRKTKDIEKLLNRCWHKADRAITAGFGDVEEIFLFNFEDKTFIEIDITDPATYHVRYFGDPETLADYLNSNKETFH